MSRESLRASKSNAYNDLLRQVNNWRKDHSAAVILAIQYNGFSSGNSDDSPFWVNAMITYEEGENTTDVAVKK